MKQFFLLCSLLFLCFSALATTFNLTANLNGAQEVPSVATPATGSMTGTYDDVTNQLMYSISYTGLTGALTAAHFHGPAVAGVNAGVKIGLATSASPMVGTVSVVQADEADLLGGRWYINLHTTTFGGGEIRGQVFDAALPVELVRFDATVKSGMVYLDWKTATELNNDYFQIAHSLDGRSFTDIGTVQGQGTTQVAKTYAYTDRQPANGLNYYRLRQVDFNGTYRNFSVVTVQVALQGISIFPNPTTGIIVVQSPATEGTLRVTDNMGRLVQQQDFSQRQSIDLGQQPTGVYFVELRVGSETTVQRIVKE